ncbi:grpE protein homolog, mitochondrial [Onthophagus taurus]|uniref:grpE protein homolog, mitochondrial n=1 Tax=Onthophagus taurus TaxID=166361 RepID=UPI000C202851|nr:grpE protein homolog, mitochondrial [Onthophagus taurus]
MSLINVRTLLKCSQIFTDNIYKSVRCSTKLRLMNTNAATSETKSDDPPSSSSDGKSTNDELEKLNKEIQDLTSKNTDLIDKYKRALADGENMRGRLTKQISEAKVFGIQSFCKDLLDVADVLGKATQSIPKEEIGDTNPHLKNLYEGLMMTEAQLQAVFKRHGLEKVDPLNEKFNPNYHEALFQQEVAGKAAGTVVVVSKIGYKLHDRVIRPALVGVAK